MIDQIDQDGWEEGMPQNAYRQNREIGDSLALKYLSTTKQAHARLIGTFAKSNESEGPKMMHLRVLKGNATILPGHIRGVNDQVTYSVPLPDFATDFEGNPLIDGAIYRISINSIYLTSFGALRFNLKHYKLIRNLIPKDYWRYAEILTVTTPKPTISLEEIDKIVSAPNFQHLVESCQSGKIFVGTIINKRSSGFSVSIDDVMCFMPCYQSTLDWDSYSEADNMIIKCVMIAIQDRTAQVLISQVENNIAINDPSVVNEALPEGETYDGIVTNSLAYGTFIKIDNSIILAHASNNKLTKKPVLGQSVKVKIIKTRFKTSDEIRTNCIIIESESDK